MGTVTKIILGNIFRNLLTALIVFLATKSVVGKDVAEKIMRGDTAPLYFGLPFNMAMVVNVLVAVSLPIVLPIGMGIWSRIKHAYATIIARSEVFAMSKSELKTEVANASVSEIISTVAKENTA